MLFLEKSQQLQNLENSPSVCKILLIISELCVYLLWIGSWIAGNVFYDEDLASGVHSSPCSLPELLPEVGKSRSSCGLCQ